MVAMKSEVELQRGHIKCLMLLNKIGANAIRKPQHVTARLFTCKTCDKKFDSFQALGGHRSSHHKKPLFGKDVQNLLKLQPPLVEDVPTKNKMHECSICGLEFPLGQALGGHMRRHRKTNNCRDHGLYLDLNLTL